MPPAPLRTSVADLALRAAVERGDLASVRRIASGPSSNPDCVSRYDGTTPFWIACCQGYLDIAKFLDQHCAVDKSLPSFTRQTPLSVACAQGHLAIVRYLVRHPQFDYRDLDLADVLGRTPFWYACDRGHLDIARFLHTTARYRFNPNHADSRGETVLHRACLNYCRDTSVTVDFLLNECVNVINVNKPTISSRWTPLHIACDTASIQLVRRLITAGANVTVRDCNGNTPLHLAVLSGCTDVVDVLVAHGSRLDACNDQCIPAYLTKTSKPEHQVNMSFHLLRNHDIISFIAV